MQERARQLRDCIARFERYLNREDITPELAEAYRAEIAAAKDMLKEIEDDGAELRRCG